MKSGKTLTSRFVTIHRGTSLAERSANTLRHLPQTWVKNGLRLNMPLQGKPKVVKMVGRSQFKQISGVVRRQADLRTHQGMRFGSVPSQANPDQVCGAAVQSPGSSTPLRCHFPRYTFHGQDG